VRKTYFPIPRKPTASPKLATFSARHRAETYFKQLVSCNAKHKFAKKKKKIFGVFGFVN
jgi:hypothetical protein